MFSLVGMDEALEKAKRKAGGATALASKLCEANPAQSITPQAITQWQRVPAGRVMDVERITGVSRHDLRPDIFGDHPARQSGSAA